MFEIRRVGLYAVDVCVGLCLVIAGFFAIAMCAADVYRFGDFFTVGGAVMTVLGVLLILSKIRRDEQADRLYTAALMLFAGLVLLLSDEGMAVTYVFLTLGAGVFGLQLLFGRPSSVRIRSDDPAMNRIMGAALLVAAVVLACLMDRMDDFYMYLVGAALIVFGAVYVVAVHKADSAAAEY